MATVVLDRDDMRRTLVRIAHEIVEKNPDGAVALVGIHRRGAVLAKRLQALTSELLEPAVPLGDRGHLVLPRRHRDCGRVRRSSTPRTSSSPSTTGRS